MAYLKVDILTNWHICKLTYFQTIIFSNWHIFKLTYFQTDLFSYWHIYKLTYLQIYILWRQHDSIWKSRVRNNVLTDKVTSWTAIAAKNTLLTQYSSKKELSKFDTLLPSSQCFYRHWGAGAFPSLIMFKVIYKPLLAFKTLFVEKCNQIKKQYNLHIITIDSV